MVHNLIDLVVAGVNGYCEVHGKTSHECGVAKELGDWVIGGLVVAGLIGALSD